MAHWSDMLTLAARVVGDPAFRELSDNPRIGAAGIERTLLDILGERVDAAARNLIHVLSENRRLDVLPDVAELYEELRADAEGTLEAELVSARPVDDAQRGSIAAALKARLGREVHLNCTVDEHLLGGAVVRAGDLVIDGSVRGKLEQLAASLTHS